MKKVFMWCLVGLLSLGSAALSQAQTIGGTEKAVAALEQQWLQSQKTNNPDLVAPLLADKFVNTGSDGKVMSKAEMLADSKATKYDSIDYEDVKVTVFGDTAIATGGSNAKGTDASGKPIDEHVRWTDTPSCCTLFFRRSSGFFRGFRAFLRDRGSFGTSCSASPISRLASFQSPAIIAGKGAK